MESYYNFGWFVPLLAAFFFYRILSNDTFVQGQEPSRPRLVAFVGLLAATVVLVTVVRLFSEANPFWRVPLWAHALLLLGFSYAVILLFGGTASLRRFAFPFFFLLMALPWPYRIETQLVHALTSLVTELTVMTVNFIGYPAVASGNTIMVADTRVGVEEACSGIRSLQTLVMMALFLGEVFRNSVGRRLLLLAGAVLIAIAFNGFRAVSLTLVTIGGDADKFQTWHDMLGNFNAILCSILLYGFAEFLNLVLGKEPPRDSVQLRWSRMPRRVILGGTVAALGGFLLAEGVVNGYYRLKEARNPPLPELALDWSVAERFNGERMELSDVLQEALQCDFGEKGVLQLRPQLEANVIHYGYTGENRMASVSSFGHSPKVCMASMGARLLGEKDSMSVQLNSIPWEIRHYEFVIDKAMTPEKVHVFWLVWEAQRMGVEAEELGSLTWRNQWQLVRNGRRNFDRQVLLIYFLGDHAPFLVREKVREILDGLVADAPRDQA
jgi:exosortase